jgi:hybrid cluster-associated redox disulfide protein
MPKLAEHLTVGEIMSRWPATIGVFLRYRMSCVGCPISGFHTLVDACEEHELDVDAVLVAMKEAAESRVSA